MKVKVDNSMIYTSEMENEFFTKSEYSHIGHDFNFKALSELTIPKLAEEVKDRINMCYMKRFTFEVHESCMFLYFYAEEFMGKNSCFIEAYWNKENYYSLDVVTSRDFSKLGLELKTKKLQKREEVK